MSLNWKNLNMDNMKLQLEEILERMKKTGDDMYPVLKAYLLFLRTDELIEKIYDKNWNWNEDDLNKIIDYHEKISNYTYLEVLALDRIKKEKAEIFDLSSLVKYYFDMRFDAWKFLATEVENKINMDLVEYYGYKITFPIDIEVIFDYIDKLTEEEKMYYYESSLLEYIGGKKDVRKLEKLSVDVMKVGSIMLYLNKTQRKYLKKNTENYKDKIIFSQLLFRWFKYKGLYRETFAIIEYFSFDIIHSSFDPNFTKQTIGNYLHYLNRMISVVYEDLEIKASEYKYFTNTLIDVLGVKSEGDLISFQLDEKILQNLPKDRDFQRMFLDLKENVILIYFYEKANLKEGFYGDYKKRFTLEEFRYWNLALYFMEEEFHIYTARFNFNKIKRFKDFFRYKFNLYVLDFEELYEEIVDMMSDLVDESLIEAKKIELKEIYKKWNMMILNEYPANERKQKIAGIAGFKKKIEYLEEKIFT